MKCFVISIDDAKYKAFLRRQMIFSGSVEAVDTAECFTRINITPDTLETPPPAWWTAEPSRWCLMQAILTALRTALKAGEDCWLFEDDCIFHSAFSIQHSAFLAGVPGDDDEHAADMIYLGGQLLATDIYPLMELPDYPEVLYAKNVHRNHAWICKLKAIPRLIEHLEAEWWPCRQTIDTRIGYLQMQPDFHVYIPKSGWLCGQMGGHSSLEHCDYPDRWWHFLREPAETERQLWLKWNKKVIRQHKFRSWKSWLSTAWGCLFRTAKR